MWEARTDFPDLEVTDKVRVSTTEAKRGRSLTTMARCLRGGKAASVGIVPRNFGQPAGTLGQLAQMLETDVESMEKKLSAGWVKSGFFHARSKPFERISGGDGLLAIQEL